MPSPRRAASRRRRWSGSAVAGPKFSLHHARMVPRRKALLRGPPSLNRSRSRNHGDSEGHVRGFSHRAEARSEGDRRRPRLAAAASDGATRGQSPTARHGPQGPSPGPRRGSLAMKLHELQPAPGSHHSRKRVGRGPGSGHGKTSTRGQKGQGARTSVNLPKTFEGGQTRLTMRTPKLRGFHNKWRKHFAVLNLTKLNRFDDGTDVRPELLVEAGIVKEVGAGIKILGTGDLGKKLTIHAHRFSAEARRKIEAAGGTVAVIEVPAPIRPKTKRAKNQPKPARPTPAPEPEAKAEPKQKKEKAPKAQASAGKEAGASSPKQPGASSGKQPKPEKGKS